MARPKRVTDYIAFLHKGKPASYNSRNKSAYQNTLKKEFSRFYTGFLPSDKELYANVFYFFSEDKNLDADNISKPTWDALNNIAYSDDKQIKIRCAAAFDVSNKKFTFDDSNLSDVAYDLIDRLLDGEDTVLIEVGVINSNSNLFNLSSLWK